MKAFNAVTALWTLLALAGASSSADDRLFEEALRQHHPAAEVIPDQRRGPLRLGLNLEGSGAHRQLKYSLQAPCQAAQQAAQCRAAILQPLPAGVYADIYELQNAASRGHGPEVRLFGKVDVESIAAYSEPTLLAVYANASRDESPAAAVSAARGCAALPARCATPAASCCSAFANGQPSGRLPRRASATRCTRASRCMPGTRSPLTRNPPAGQTPCSPRCSAWSWHRPRCCWTAAERAGS